MYIPSFTTAHIVSQLLLLVCLPQCRLASQATIAPTYRIIGGEEALEAEYPFVVHLLTTVAPKEMYSCTGMIIHEEWVLTAAHCISKHEDGSPYVVRVYAGGIDYTKNTTNTQVINSVDTIVHRDYDSERVINDVALVQLETPFDLTGCCVQKGRLTEGRFPAVESISCTAIGFGMTMVDEDKENVKLHKLNLKASILVECFRVSYYINDIFNLHPFAYPERSGQKICVVAGEGKNICFGDSGGPLVCNGLLVGVASYLQVKAGAYRREYTCVSKASMGVYTFTGHHMQWIRDRVPNITEPGTLSAAGPVGLDRGIRSLWTLYYAGLLYHVALKLMM